MVVELLERHSRRLAANLYRARLIRVDDGPKTLTVVLGVETGSFEHQQLSGTDVVAELNEYLSKKVGKTARLVLEDDAPGSHKSEEGPAENVASPSSPASAPQGDSPESEPTPSEPQATVAPSLDPDPAPPPDAPKAAPRSLAERDDKWRRDEEARKRQEALSHPAVKDTAEILDGSIQEVRVLE